MDAVPGLIPDFSVVHTEKLRMGLGALHATVKDGNGNGPGTRLILKLTCVLLPHIQTSYSSLGTRTLPQTILPQEFKGHQAGAKPAVGC